MPEVLPLSGDSTIRYGLAERLDRREWVIEQTILWLSGYRRLGPATNAPRNSPAFLAVAAVLCCYERLVRPTTQDTVMSPAQSI
ncbi:hypothetical protein ACIRP3_00825 [Streptomyces sp. NPDC101209]|uniref:hypothetical protein n=1 Tax=Streptomyces sp. NPDC101209 TaxID=3366129 RepID=UPI0038285E48